MAIQFDTLRYVEKLESAGVPESQAKAYAEALATALDQKASWALTAKEGLVDIKAGLADIRIGLADIKSDLKLMKWMLGSCRRCSFTGDESIHLNTD